MALYSIYLCPLPSTFFSGQEDANQKGLNAKFKPRRRDRSELKKSALPPCFVHSESLPTYGQTARQQVQFLNPIINYIILISLYNICQHKTEIPYQVVGKEKNPLVIGQRLGKATSENCLKTTKARTSPFFLQLEYI